MDNVKDIITKAAASGFEKVKKKYNFDCPDKIEVQLPNKVEFGDWSTPASLKIAKENKINPIELSETVARAIKAESYDFLEKVEVY